MLPQISGDNKNRMSHTPIIISSFLSHVKKSPFATTVLHCQWPSRFSMPKWSNEKDSKSLAQRRIVLTQCDYMIGA